MPLTFEQIIQKLAALKAEDFDYTRSGANGIAQIDALTDELLTLPHPERAIRMLFDVMERMPDVDLGTPGSFVHTLEKFVGQYEGELVESIKRRPTPLTVWMVNRIVNATKTSAQRNFYMDLLHSAMTHPKATEFTKLDAKHFIDYQNKSRGN